MKKLFVLAFATGMFVACNSASTSNADSTAVEPSAIEAAPADSVAADSTAIVADTTATPAADSAHQH